MASVDLRVGADPAIRTMVPIKPKYRGGLEYLQATGVFPVLRTSKWETGMRLLLLMLGIVAASAAFGGTASAQNYPWCAVYGGADTGGSSNCGFVTFEQCMATLSGMGGFCNRNTQFVPPPGPYSAPAYRQR